jgi:hypothetical protein
MIRRFKIRRHRAIALALSACALSVTAPTAVAAPWENLHPSHAPHAAQGAEQPAVGYEDMHASVARAAAQAADKQAQSATAARDLRSPDARDAANGITTGTQSATAARDLRSPDARDAANGITTRAQPTPVGTRTVVTVEDSGSQTLAIAFSIGALLLSLLAVAFVGIGRRPRPRWSAP